MCRMNCWLVSRLDSSTRDRGRCSGEQAYRPNFSCKMYQLASAPMVIEIYILAVVTMHPKMNGRRSHGTYHNANQSRGVRA